MPFNISYLSANFKLKPIRLNSLNYEESLPFSSSDQIMDVLIELLKTSLWFAASLWYTVMQLFWLIQAISALLLVVIENSKPDSFVREWNLSRLINSLDISHIHLYQCWLIAWALLILSGALLSVFWFLFKAWANLSVSWPFAVDHCLPQLRITFRWELFMRRLRQFLR